MTDRRSFRLAPIIIGLACVALGYVALGQGVSGLFAERDPDLVLTLWPADARALQAKARISVREALTSEEIDEAGQVSLRAVKAAPLGVQGLRSLAVSAQLDGDVDRAAAVMGLAGRRNLRDPEVHTWLFEHNLAAGRYDAAYLNADLLLRRQPDQEPAVFPAMTAAASKAEAMSALLKRLGEQPIWRPDFFRWMSQQPGGVDVAIGIADALKGSARAATPAEGQILVSTLAEQHRYVEARRLLAALAIPGGAGAGLVNGDFEQEAGTPPFNWRMFTLDGAIAEIDRLPGGGGRGLYVEFPNGRRPMLAEQMLVLPAGAWRLSGKARVESLPDEGAMTWNVVCAEDGRLIGQGVVSQTGERTFSADFQTPAAGCAAQWLRLGGQGALGGETAKAYFDDMRITRQGA